MKLPLTANATDVVTATEAPIPLPIPALPGTLLLLGILTGFSGPKRDLNVVKENPQDFSGHNVFSQPPTDIDDSIQKRSKRTTNENESTRARHLETKGIKIRLNRDSNTFLGIQDGSFVINPGQDSDNNPECMQRHVFQVAVLAPGEFVMIESNSGDDFMHTNDDGDMAIINDPSEDVRSVLQTDSRFFKLFKRDIGQRYYVIQNYHSGRFVNTENDTISMIEESELESKGASVEFDVYNCDVTSSS